MKAAIIGLLAIVSLMALWSYALACSRLDKWLTPRGWWDRVMCRHEGELVVAADAKGRPVLECQHCGRDVAIPPSIHKQ